MHVYYIYIYIYMISVCGHPMNQHMYIHTVEAYVSPHPGETIAVYACM